MKLPNIVKVTAFSLFVSFAAPVSSYAYAAEVPTASATANANDPDKDAAVYSKLVTRLSEIQSMDKSSLSKEEKKNLRAELKDMKQAADGLNSRVYISVGAIIIAILLLILILR